MLKEFKEFALKGNMVDLAIGIVIGVAFGALVGSIVADILMPVIAVFTGGIDFSNLFVQLHGTPASTLADAQKNGATLAYGHFITLLINFLIVAFVLFLVVKAMNRMKREQPAAPVAPPAPTREVVLLEEIRNLLAKRPA